MDRSRRSLRTFLRRPWRTGTVVPSSARLARLMVEDMGLEAAETVVELGAGTGVFTRLIGEKVKRGALVLSFEIDPALAVTLDGRIPGVRIVNDSAENLESHLSAAGRSSAESSTTTMRSRPGTSASIALSRVVLPDPVPPEMR